MKIYNITLEACLEIEAQNPQHAIGIARRLFGENASLLRPTYIWENKYKRTWQANPDPELNLDPEEDKKGEEVPF